MEKITYEEDQKDVDLSFGDEADNDGDVLVRRILRLNFDETREKWRQGKRTPDPRDRYPGSLVPIFFSWSDMSDMAVLNSTPIPTYLWGNTKLRGKKKAILEIGQ